MLKSFTSKIVPALRIFKWTTLVECVVGGKETRLKGALLQSIDRIPVTAQLFSTVWRCPKSSNICIVRHGITESVIASHKVPSSQSHHSSATGTVTLLQSKGCRTHCQQLQSTFYGSKMLQMHTCPTAWANPSYQNSDQNSVNQTSFQPILTDSNQFLLLDTSLQCFATWSLLLVSSAFHQLGVWLRRGWKVIPATAPAAILQGHVSEILTSKNWDQCHALQMIIIIICKR